MGENASIDNKAKGLFHQVLIRIHQGGLQKRFNISWHASWEAQRWKTRLALEALLFKDYIQHSKHVYTRKHYTLILFQRFLEGLFQYYSIFSSTYRCLPSGFARFHRKSVCGTSHKIPDFVMTTLSTGSIHMTDLAENSISYHWLCRQICSHWVVLHNTRPGVSKALGADFEKLNAAWTGQAVFWYPNLEDNATKAFLFPGGVCIKRHFTFKTHGGQLPRWTVVPWHLATRWEVGRPDVAERQLKDW